MALRIIKQGSARASSVQQFFFSENFSEMAQIPEPFTWPEASSFADAPARKMPEAMAEPAEPAVDLAKLEKAAFDNGFLQGQMAGKDLAEKQIEGVMRRYADTVQAISTLKTVLRAQVEREVVRLALEVAKKIVYREIRIDPAIIQTLVRVALSHVAEKSAVTVHVSPVDYAYLLKQRAELSQTEGRDVSLVADNSIQQGGCLIQTDCGDIDARIEEKFREVENAFFEGLK